MNKYAIGKCKTMCPIDEMKMRQKEKLLHSLEIVPGTEKSPEADPNRTVKMYNRSAAGKFMTNENYLRPPSVLYKTVNHLLTTVVKDAKYSWITKYDFIADRLRAVRQDMIIQNISQEEGIKLIEPMVKFYAFSSYFLCENDIHQFDPHLNKKTLQECLNYLLVLYSHVEYHSSDYEGKFLEHVNQSRPFFEALNFILNFGNEEILLRLLSLAKKWRTTLVNTVILMGIHYSRKNFVKVYRYMENFPAILAGVCSLQLPVIRRKTFEMMSVAYSSKNLRFTLSDLKELMLYESERDLIDDCEHYGFITTENYVHFDKNSFKNSADEIRPKKVCHLEQYFKNINYFTFMSDHDDILDLINTINNLKL